MILSTPVSTCHVCSRDRILNTLKATVNALQIELRVEWRASPIIQVDDFILIGERNRRENWYLQNDKGSPMVIPSYGIYTRMWEKAFFKVPLEIDWSLFDVHSTDDTDYLTSIIEVLEDQRDLWAYDVDTQGQAITIMFDRYIRNLKRLAMYCFTIGFLKF